MEAGTDGVGSAVGDPVGLPKTPLMVGIYSYMYHGTVVMTVGFSVESHAPEILFTAYYPLYRSYYQRLRIDSTARPPAWKLGITFQ